MNIAQPIVDAIACRISEILSLDATLFSDIARAGIRDGKKIYFRGESEIQYDDTKTLTAFHVFDELQRAERDPWNDRKRKATEGAFVLKGKFVVLSEASLIQDVLPVILLAFDEKYEAENDSAEVRFQSYTENLHEIIKAFWADSWDAFQPKQGKIAGAMVKYSLELKTCQFC